MSNNGKKITNVFEAILEYGHDEDFVPYEGDQFSACLLYTSPSPRDQRGSRMPSSA